MHFPFSVTGSVKGSVELKVAGLKVNLLIAPGPLQSGDMLETFPEALNIYWFPEKPKNFHALAVSLWKAFPVRDLGGWGSPWLINRSL